MIVTCNECDTSFNFPEKFIKESGTKVRCSKCRKIFNVFPSGSAPAAQPEESTATPPAASNGPSADSAALVSPAAATGLDDLDLNEIENMLDLDAGDDKAAAAGPTSEPDDLDLTFDIDEPSVASKPDIEFDQTKELDFSEMDLTDSAVSEPSSDAAEDLDLDLDFDAGPEGGDEKPVGKTTTDAAADSDDELNLDLDFDLDTDEVAPAGDASDEDATEELGFDLDLNFDDAEGGELSGTAKELDETQDFNLDDLDDLLDEDDSPVIDSADELTEDLMDLDLDLEDEITASADSEAADDDIDLDLDLDMEAEPAAKQSSAEPLDDLDFELDIEADDDNSDFADAMNSEETAELDLSDLEEIIEDDPAASGAGSDSTDDVDFELDLDFDGEQGEASVEDDIDMGETEELDLSGLEDALDVDQDATDDLEDLDLEIDIDDDEMLDAADETSDEDYELADLDDMLIDEGEMEEGDDSGAETADFGLELDLSDTAEDTAEPESAEDGEYDLSDLDDMLDIDEADAPAEALADDDLELDVEFDDAISEDQTEETADIELDFEMDDNSAEPASAAAGARAKAVGDLEDTFDMGTLPGAGDNLDSEEDDVDYALEDDDDLAAESPKKKGGLLRTLLILLIFLGGGYGAMIIAQAAGFVIPFVPDLPGSQMPFLTNLVGGGDEHGNLEITILEPKLDGRFVENSKTGLLFVIKGVVKNSYNHPRSFIQVKGKLYTKGRKKSKTQVIYAGNVISDADLGKLNQAAINKRLNNRFGNKRSNVNVKSGRSVPFMIVFSKLPNNLDEYTVEIASSKKAK